MPPKRKADVFSSKIPWENVTANTLRSLCKDVAGTSVGHLTKQAMIALLTDIEQHGVDAALENVTKSTEFPEPSKPSKPAAPTTPASTRTRTTSLKRKKPEPAPADDEDEEENGAAEQPASEDNALPYNTRHKGQKRVRVTAPPLPKMPSARRKSTASRTAKKDVEEEPEEAVGETSVTPVKRGRGRPRKSTTTTSAAPAAPAKTDAASGSTVKRGRGRPRKQPAPSPPKKAVGSGKQVFDGVELKRARTRDTTEDDDADGELDEEAPVAPNGETSSLGSSNKAQEEIVTTEVVSTQISLADAINQANELAQAA